MPRNVFYSFHYDFDNWRASKIRNIGQVEGQRHAFDNEWEAVRRNTDPAIRNWIKSQMRGRSCVIVLVGAETAGRKWIDFEIEHGWNAGMGVLGIHIHGILDRFNRTTHAGNNPFAHFTVNQRTPMNDIVPTYNPQGIDSAARYRYIAANIENWIDHAIAIRKRH